MDDKMRRFLNSIGIDNVDAFDMSFDLCSRNLFDHDLLDMVIVKTHPWEYYELRQFQDALNNIDYKYTLAFSYLNHPTALDALKLFEDWYQTIYRIPNQLDLSTDEGNILITYEDEAQKDKMKTVILDFKDFLAFIFYDFKIVEKVLEKEEENDFTKKEIKKIIKMAAETAEFVVDNEEIIESEESKEIESKDDKIEQLRNDLETKILKEKQAAAAQMKKDREMARRNKRGDYNPIDLIDALDTNFKNVDIVCYIFSSEAKKSFGSKERFVFGLNDKSGGAIYANFSWNSNLLPKDKIDLLVRGAKVRVRGCVYFDEFAKQLSIQGHFIDLLPDDEIETDNEPVQRVELHLHSRMSAMDAPASMKDYTKYAKQLGMKALAITDHGCVQGYPDAQKFAKKNDLKVLYGIEFYMVDDEVQYIKNPSETPLNRANYVIFDLETTGLSCKYDRIIEFGAVRVERGVEVARLDILINPEIPVPEKIVKITNITNAMLKDKPTIKEALPKILEFVKDSILIGHNVDFDFSFLNESLKRNGYDILTNPVIDTLALSRYLFPLSRNHRLGTLCRNMDVHYDEEAAHRGDYDAQVLNEVWQAMLVKLTKDNRSLKHSDLAKLDVSIDMLMHIHPYHMIALAKNYEGLNDLYRLVSMSNIEYLAKLPKIPRRELSKLRKNLLFGSGCLNGEVFENASHKNDEALEKSISFYDYVEIQPVGNYVSLINRGDFQSVEEVKRVLKDIVNAADKVGKLVCATGDVHYCKKDDKIFRDVYISAKGLGGEYHPLNLNPYGKADIAPYENPDQHFRSTKEMLDEMEFLGKEKAYEVTITNTNLIADMIEKMVPLPNDHLYTPTIDNCEQMLKDICYKTAHELYGENLPEIVQNRLEIELNGIISNGYSVIYYIASKIVNKANSDGYVVGSRGSVGSSFVATMAKITEVNPLPPHYRCPHCKHIEWTSEVLPEIKSGCDLPIKKCPICGATMNSDGQNIPFETFLGFKADKTPDIDLNFPNDYQSRAHDYTKELLGEENVFRAGTVETVADKTAFGYARGYFERLGYNPDEVSKAKISYLAAGCVDVKRTTGQHPGGIVVIPASHEVYDFTPIQFPAEDRSSSWKTTHFDFHSLHDTLLKLDLLGHVDPLALKMMCDITGIKIEDIPLNDAKVISIFSTVDALNLKRNYLAQKTGAMGIPEFGTEFVRGMLEKTNPSSFADLVIVSGLSHGTNVWQGNAELLISDGKTDLKGVIGCRDDIMTYLISMGIDPQISFAIMEDVRHGKGVKEEFEKAMIANKVPQYYIDSCKKIKYLFPKGHATAYVMMAVRVGYFKIYHPLVYYSTFFSVRSKQYDIDTMIRGERAIVDRLTELTTKSRDKTQKMSPKEEDILKTLQIAVEMVQRGMKFENIDLYKSDATNFVIDKENNALIPPFITIDGLGESAAQSVIEARKNGDFFSKEDLLRRTKLNETNVKDLTKLHVLDNLDDTDQLSLFDF
ncbi:MAG: PolC-type DNA polymerase III [Erysipelotrichaceae bacterium]|jgi:DNA polymerase-3 subunit alpha (Gram-positive type)|nr:PolC-type DNA polymerase III [Erysipelotrichaceae bacterium]